MTIVLFTLPGNPQEIHAELPGTDWDFSEMLAAGRAQLGNKRLRFVESWERP